MKLLPLDDGTFDQAAEWLSREEIYRWLDFGLGVQGVSRVALKAMTQRDIHCIRVYTPEDDDTTPIGIVALSNISRPFKTANLWAILGERHYGGRGQAYRAAARILTHAFRDMRLESVQAWAVEPNVASIRSLKRLNFQYVGRLRRCHAMDGQMYDRLLFDLLASEHRDF